MSLTADAAPTNRISGCEGMTSDPGSDTHAKLPRRYDSRLPIAAFTAEMSTHSPIADADGAGSCQFLRSSPKLFSVGG